MVRDIKALDFADETRDPASIHPYDGPSCAVGSKIGPRWVGLLPTAGSDLAVRRCHQIIWIWAIPSPAE